MEANLLRAHAGQDAIEVAEALLYLKPCQFLAAKALNVYKNYQVSIVHNIVLMPFNITFRAEHPFFA